MLGAYFRYNYVNNQWRKKVCSDNFVTFAVIIITFPGWKGEKEDFANEFVRNLTFFPNIITVENMCNDIDNDL